MHTDSLSHVVDNDDEKPAWVGRRDIWSDDQTDLMSDLRMKAQTWRAAFEATNDLRADLNAAIIAAKKAGHSFSQLRDATNMGVGALQLILAKSGYKEPSGGSPDTHTDADASQDT